MGLLVGLALFGLVLVQLGLAQTWAALQGLDVGYLAAACGMFAISYAIKVSKWYWMQRRAGLHRSWVSVTHLYFGTRVGGLLTPLRSGEFVPGLVGEDKAAVLAITFFDRLIETSQTLLTFVVVFALFAYQFVAPAGLWSLAVLFGLVGLLCVPLLWPERTVRGFLGALDWLGRRARLQRLGWFARLEALAQDHVTRFFDIASRFFSPHTTTGLLGVTFLGWFFDILVYFFVFRAVGAFLDLLVVMVSMMTLAMVNFVAPTPSGLGIGDLSLAVILDPLGHRGEIGAFLIVVRLLIAGLTAGGYVLFNWLDR